MVPGPQHGLRQKGADMARYFPFFGDITGKEIYVYGAGRIASRRVEMLLLFAPAVTVTAPMASDAIEQVAAEGRLTLVRGSYEPDSIPNDAFMVLAATNDVSVNEAIYAECREKGIPVNVCSDRTLCDFQFPGVAVADELVIGVNAGGENHGLARAWTDKIRKEVEEAYGNDNQAEKTSHNGETQKNGERNPHG